MSAITVAVRRIGRERQPVAIIDGFHPHADALRDCAVHAVFEAAGRHYPGVRAPLPPAYFSAVDVVIGQVLADLFALPPRARVLDASFSIVTAPAETLSVEQRLPHVDAIEPGRVALIHYLARDDTDGTAFYRHRASGWETIDAARSPPYLAQLNAELRAGGPPAPGYIAGDTPLFERVETVPAKYNRAILYRSAMLHSGAITPGRVLAADPTTGRLTITGFLAG